MFSKKSSVISRQSSVFQNGQTLIELIVVISVSIIVIGALVFTTIVSLRNAEFSKNQAQATKLAQEGIERVRTGRDRNGQISILGVPATTVDSWNGAKPIWNYQISGTGLCDDPAGGKCFFNVDSAGNLSGIGFGWTLVSLPSQVEGIPSGAPVFHRVVSLSDTGTVATQKRVTVIVRWTDFSGDHESRLTTILRII